MLKHEHIGPRAFGGAPLNGDRLVRLIYLDESGTSANEKFATVAGVVVNFDQQIASVDNHLSALVGEFVSPGHRQGFVFHSTDLMWGAKKGKPFSRIETSDEQRWPVLDRLAAAPRELRLSLVLGFVRRTPPPSGVSSERHEKILHSMAYLQAIKAADSFLRHQCPENEFGLVVAERKIGTEKALRAAHDLAQNGDLVEKWLPPFFHEGLPVQRIKDTVHFADKPDCRPLQLADVVAFVLRRHLDGSDRNERFLSSMFGGVSSPAILGQLNASFGSYAYIDWMMSDRPQAWNIRVGA